MKELFLFLSFSFFFFWPWTVEKHCTLTPIQAQPHDPLHPSPCISSPPLHPRFTHRPKPTTNTSSAANQLAGPPSASAPDSAAAERLQTCLSKITVTYQKSNSYLVKHIHSQTLANSKNRAPEKRENRSMYHIIPGREKTALMWV